MSRLLIVHWLDPNLPHSIKLCEEVFCLSRLKPKQCNAQVSSHINIFNSDDKFSELFEDSEDKNYELEYKSGAKRARLNDDSSSYNSLTVDQRANRIDYGTIQSMAINASENKMTPVDASCIVNGKIAVSKRPYPSFSSVLSFSKNFSPEKAAEFSYNPKDVVDKVMFRGTVQNYRSRKVSNRPFSKLGRRSFFARPCIRRPGM